MSTKQTVAAVTKYTCDECGKNYEGARVPGLDVRSPWWIIYWQYYNYSGQKDACSLPCLKALTNQTLSDNIVQSSRTHIQIYMRTGRGDQPR